VIDISAEAIRPPPRFEGETLRHERLVAGKVRVGDDIVTLLDAGLLMHQPQGLAGENTEQMSPVHNFCLEATPQEHAVFRSRAKTLMDAASEEEGTRLPLAVVELDGEYFGIELQAVQEFCDIVRPCPIPCCPPHILGAISLRGNLFTLLDLRAALNLPRATQSSGKAVVARFGEQPVGVAVDQVHDVIYLREEELQTAPAALVEQHGAEIKGTAPYGGKMMAVLDLPALLARQEWIVNETV
jgi:purine-binding chemotaxis protein CheW